jgi:hypothetical protein
MGARRGANRILWRNMRKKDYLADPGVVRRIILRWIFRKWDGRHGLD